MNELTCGSAAEGKSMEWKAADSAALTAWLGSPCSRCALSPCCRNLPLTNLSIHTRSDLLHALDLVRHRHIEIGLRENGEWTVFYTRACRFLDLHTAKCSIHDMPMQSDICKRYDPHNCWYRRVFIPTTANEMIRMNAQRVRRLIDLVIFDDNDRIYRTPNWERMQEEFRLIPLSLSAVDAGAGPPDLPPADDQPVDVLYFPPGRPTHRKHFDLVRFRLGFPGVTLRIRGDEWLFAVDTRDEASSAAARPGETTVTLEGLDSLIAACTYDQDGTIAAYPDLAAVLPTDESIRSAVSPVG